jgi:hypothetical protein
MVCRITGYFTSDNEPDGIENAVHNTGTFPKKAEYFNQHIEMYCGLHLQFRRAHYHFRTLINKQKYLLLFP